VHNTKIAGTNILYDMDIKSLLGICQMVRHSEEERLAWISTINQQVQQHDAKVVPEN
jgi:hypothetical protein